MLYFNFQAVADVCSRLKTCRVPSEVLLETITPGFAKYTSAMISVSAFTSGMYV